MDYAPAFVYTGEGKLHPVILHLTNNSLSILNCRTREQVVEVCLPFTLEIDNNTEYLFRIRYDRVYVFFSPFRSEIIQALNLDAPQSLVFAAVGQFVQVTALGLKLNSEYYDFEEVQLKDGICQVGRYAINLIDNVAHQLLFELCAFLHDHESSEEDEEIIEDYNQDMVEQYCQTVEVEEEQSLGCSIELGSTIKAPLSPQQPLLNSEILQVIASLPADEDADVFAVAEALENFPEDVQQILEAAILNDPSRMSVIADYDLADIIAYIRALVGDQDFTDEQEEIDEALGGLRAALLNRQSEESEEVKDNSELSFECATSFTNEKAHFNPFSGNAKSSWHSADDNGCNTSSLTGASAVSSSIKSKNTSVFSHQFKSYAMSDYFNSVDDAVKYMQQERVALFWIKKRFSEYKIALNCVFDLNSESVCEIFYSNKPKKPLLFNPHSTSFEVERCVLPKDVEGMEAIDKYCIKKKIGNWAPRCLIFTNSHGQTLPFVFDSEDECSHVQIAVTMICEALIMPEVLPE